MTEDLPEGEDCGEGQSCSPTVSGFPPPAFLSFLKHDFPISLEFQHEKLILERGDQGVAWTWGRQTPPRPLPPTKEPRVSRPPPGRSPHPHCTRRRPWEGASRTPRPGDPARTSLVSTGLPPSTLGLDRTFPRRPEAPKLQRPPSCHRHKRLSAGSRAHRGERALSPAAVTPAGRGTPGLGGPPGVEVLNVDISVRGGLPLAPQQEAFLGRRFWNDSQEEATGQWSAPRVPSLGPSPPAQRLFQQLLREGGAGAPRPAPDC